ncbi:MAG: hypothetical protein GY928_05780 [Colwellia sp.]|nr:hypothetical protein [Colwellia sp.]
MWGFLGKMFGTDKAAASVIDNVSNGLDKLWYTEEEKAGDKALAIKEGNQVYMEWLRSTSGSRLARRFIAVVVTITWALQYIMSLGMSMVAPWLEDPKVVEALMESSKALSENGEQGNAAFMVILGFYFLGNKADALIKGAVEKFKAK